MKKGYNFRNVSNVRPPIRINIFKNRHTQARYIWDMVKTGYNIEPCVKLQTCEICFHLSYTFDSSTCFPSIDPSAKDLF